MRHITRLFMVAAAGAALLLPTSATAASITFSFTGTVGFLGAPGSDPLGLVGQTFSGSMTVDTSVLDSNALANEGQYANAVTAASIDIGSLNVSATGGNVTIWDDRGSGPYQDKYEVPSFTGVTDNNAAYSFALMFLLLLDTDASIPIGMVTTDSLNQVPILVSGINQKYLQMDYWPTTSGSSCVTAGAANCSKLKLTLDTFTVTEVPEPASLILLGFGLAMVSLSLKRRSAR